jgi:hypothetical protein
MTLSKSDPAFDFKEWMKAAKEQEEKDGFFIPDPITKEIIDNPGDFVFKREGWTMIVEWKGHETMYFPIMEGKHESK